MNIAVVIPTYNRQNLLFRALRSVYAQTRLPDEVIVIDDGSTDNTKSKLRAKFPDITYCYQDNAGVSAARNTGISKSQSEWLAFLDSDDVWLPEKLAKQELALQDNPDYCICHTEEQWLRNGKRVNAMRKHAKKGGWIFQHCLPLCVMSPSSIIIHRNIFNQVGYFDTSLPVCEDYDLWLKITARYPVLFIEQPLLIKYGGHDDQLSKKYWGMDRFRIKALENILARSNLNDANRTVAIAILKYKAKIFAQGALKRGKKEDAQYYQTLVDKSYDEKS